MRRALHWQTILPRNSRSTTTAAAAAVPFLLLPHRPPEQQQRRYKSTVAPVPVGEQQLWSSNHKETAVSKPAWTVPYPRPAVVPHAQSPTRTVPSHIGAPHYAGTGFVPAPDMDAILIHEIDSIEHMRAAGQLAATVLRDALELARTRVGMTTDDLDAFVHQRIIGSGAYPSPLNYCGFPKSLCTSVNEVVCHGIPDARPLQFGDVVSLDISCFLDLVHGDNCGTVIVGDFDDEDPSQPRRTFASPQCESHFGAARRLVTATRQCLMEAIGTVRPGSCLTDIGAACQDVADSYGYSSVTQYRGHGIGPEFHIPPFVRHFRNHHKLELRPGMIFTIEPMICQYGNAVFEWPSDRWTVATADRGLAAQFEHMVLVTDSGVEILTIPEGSDQTER